MNSREEFDQLYQKLKHRVFSTVLSYLPQIEEAEEVTQDVFLEAFQKLGTFKGESSLETWVYKITINKCLDAIRYKNRKKRFAFFSNLYQKDSSELAHDTAHYLDPQQQFENKELSLRLQKAIQHLNSQQKSAIVLIYIAQLSYKEAAETLNCSVKALESLISRAKVKLKAELSEKNEG